jgi:hypothetical protein
MGQSYIWLVAGLGVPSQACIFKQKLSEAAVIDGAFFYLIKVVIDVTPPMIIKPFHSATGLPYGRKALMTA